MVFASRNDIPYITAFYGGVFVFVHQLIGFVHKTLVVADRRGGFVVHNHLNSFAFGVLVNGFDIKIGVRCLEVEYQIFGMSKPIFPPYVPTFYQYAIKTIFGGKVDIFLHIFGSSPVLAVGFEGGVIGFTDMYTRNIVSVRPFFHTSNHFPPYPYVLHWVNPRSISQSARFVEVEGDIGSQNIAGIVANNHCTPRRLGRGLHITFGTVGIGGNPRLEYESLVIQIEVHRSVVY